MSSLGLILNLSWIVLFHPQALLRVSGYAEADWIEQTVAELLLLGADPNACCTGVFSNSALHETTLSDNGIVASALVAAGADMEARNVLDRTPLHEAAVQNSVKVAKVLIEAGANIHATDYLGNTALDFARESWSWEVAELLEWEGANRLTRKKCKQRRENFIVVARIIFERYYCTCAACMIPIRIKFVSKSASIVELLFPKYLLLVLK